MDYSVLLVCRYLQISYTSMGEVVTVELVPNGAQVAVTNEVSVGIGRTSGMNLKTNTSVLEVLVFL